MPSLVLLAVSTGIAGTHRSSGLDCRNCRPYLCSRMHYSRHRALSPAASPSDFECYRYTTEIIAVAREHPLITFISNPEKTAQLPPAHKLKKYWD